MASWWASAARTATWCASSHRSSSAMTSCDGDSKSSTRRCNRYRWSASLPDPAQPTPGYDSISKQTAEDGMPKQIISTDRAPIPGGVYSQGVQWDQLVFTAGQVAADPGT